VSQRAENSSPNETPAQWDGIIAEMDKFHPWDQDEALFVDSIYPVDANFQKIRNYLLT
jgi:hypothetical protein